MSSAIIIQKRRFTCLSPTLVRMEFSPDGVFEPRRSLTAHEPQNPVAFKQIAEEQGATVLETGRMTIVTRHNDRAFFPSNLEVRWIHRNLLQYWRPGDRDYRNLGGTVRSLDRADRDTRLSGVHAADSEPLDAKANEWLSLLQDEEDTYYNQHSPVPPAYDQHPHYNARFHPDDYLARTINYTLEQHHFSPGILSRSGYCLLNDSFSAVMDEDNFPVERNRPGYQDWYFFAYGENYTTALADFIRLTGRAPLPTRNTFGLIFSRWPAFKEEEARQIIEEFRRDGMPLSTLVLDMEWHKEGWGHWDWDPATYPDPAAFFRWCHEQGLEVTLNDHPLDLRQDDSHFQAYVDATGTAGRVKPKTFRDKTVPMVNVNWCDKREAMAFCRICHTPILKQGMDYWWNDGCLGAMNGASSQLVGNKLFFEEAETAEKRGMLLSRYGGLGSHRYGVFFTGDTLSCWEVLATECEFNIRSGHLGLAYVSHDIGGFISDCKAPLLNPALYLRWLQFGVFSPVLRLHSSPGCGSRKPRDYGPECLAIARRWLRVRNSLLPYIYSASRAHHNTGIPLVKGLFLDRTREEACYRFDEYEFGPSLLVAPILTAENHRQVYLPPGQWYSFESDQIESGGREIFVEAGIDQVPVYVKAGTILVRRDPDDPLATAHYERLVLDVYPGAQGVAELYEDDGRSPGYKHGIYCRTRFELQEQ